LQIGSAAGWTLRCGKQNFLAWPNPAILAHWPLDGVRSAQPIGTEEYPFPLVIEIRAPIHELEISVKEFVDTPPSGVR
jgi:hypothetical protein